MIDDRRFDDLPPNWQFSDRDLRTFSRSKNLWDYQQNAVENAITVLWKYFEDFVDYEDGERLDANFERKRKFFQWYQDNGLEENLELRLKNNTQKIELLSTC